MLCFKWENSYYNEKLRQRSRDCLPLKLYMWHNLRFKNEKHHLCFFISKSVLQFQRQTYTKKDVSVIILVMIMKELEKEMLAFLVYNIPSILLSHTY